MSEIKRSVIFQLQMDAHIGLLVLSLAFILTFNSLDFIIIEYFINN
jgi:hypothetical protein